MKYLTRYPLIWIFVLASLIRLWDLGNLPNGFFRDEAAKGYNGWLLSTQGHDIDGQHYPLFTRELATYNSAFYTYLTIPFIKLAGLSETTTRLPAAIAGILTVLLLYIVVRKLFNERIAVWSSFFLAVSPWHVQFSRWANQGILVPLFALGLIYFLHQAIEKVKSKDRGNPPEVPREGLLFLVFASLCGGMMVYTYDITKVFLPLLLVLLIGIYWQFWKKHFLKLSIFCILVLLICIPSLFNTLGNNIQSQARFNRISLLSQPFTPWEMAWQFILNWFSHYDPGYLFIHGDMNLRHSTGYTGLLLWIEPILIFLGLYWLWKHKTPESKLWVGWLIVYPIPSSLTMEGIPHALRSIPGVVVFPVVSALGLIYLLELIQKYQPQKIHFYRTIIMLLTSASALYFLCIYFGPYRYASQEPFQYGMNKTVAWWNNNKDGFSRTVVSPSLGMPEIFFLFYNQIPDNFGNYFQKSNLYFEVSETDIQQWTQSERKPTLYILDPDDFPEARTIHQITDSKGKMVIKMAIYP